VPSASPRRSGHHTACPSFRQLLQEELTRRCALNPRYSLRAFARRLEVHHSTLSQILRGKRRLTPRGIGKFGQLLGVEAGEIAAWIAREGAHSPGVDERSRREVARVAREAAAVLNGWHHFAILELTRLETFRPDSRWIAQVLGITPDEVNIAVQRLVRMKLLDMNAPDRWTDLSGNGLDSAHRVAHVLFARLTEQARVLADGAT